MAEASPFMVPISQEVSTHSHTSTAPDDGLPDRQSSTPNRQACHHTTVSRRAADRIKSGIEPHHPCHGAHETHDDPDSSVLSIGFSHLANPLTSEPDRSTTCTASACTASDSCFAVSALGILAIQVGAVAAFQELTETETSLVYVGGLFGAVVVLLVISDVILAQCSRVASESWRQKMCLAITFDVISSAAIAGSRWLTNGPVTHRFWKSTLVIVTSMVANILKTGSKVYFYSQVKKAHAQHARPSNPNGSAHQPSSSHTGDMKAYVNKQQTIRKTVDAHTDSIDANTQRVGQLHKNYTRLEKGHKKTKQVVDALANHLLSPKTVPSHYQAIDSSMKDAQSTRVKTQRTWNIFGRFGWSRTSLSKRDTTLERGHSTISEAADTTEMSDSLHSKPDSTQSHDHVEYHAAKQGTGTIIQTEKNAYMVKHGKLYRANNLDKALLFIPPDLALKMDQNPWLKSVVFPNALDRSLYEAQASWKYNGRTHPKKLTKSTAVNNHVKHDADDEKTLEKHHQLHASSKNRSYSFSYSARTSDHPLKNPVYDAAESKSDDDDKDDDDKEDSTHSQAISTDLNYNATNSHKNTPIITKGRIRDNHGNNPHHRVKPKKLTQNVPLSRKETLSQLNKTNEAQLKISENERIQSENLLKAKTEERMKAENEAKKSEIESKERLYNELKEEVGAVQAHQMVYGKDSFSNHGQSNHKKF